MKRLIAGFCAFLLIATAVFAQETQDEHADDDEQDKDIVYSVNYNLNQPGDQYINIALMVTFPMNFGGDFPLYRTGQLNTGGAGMLGYHRFITGWLAWGIDINFGYNPTIGSNIFTYVPIMFNLTFQPTFKKLEFPITLGVGAAMESYLSRTYFPGLALKGDAGVFYRATPSWAFGIAYDFMYLPQWYQDADKRKYNDYGIFSSVMLAARYYF